MTATESGPTRLADGRDDVCAEPHSADPAALSDVRTRLLGGRTVECRRRGLQTPRRSDPRSPGRRPDARRTLRLRPGVARRPLRIGHLAPASAAPVPPGSSVCAVPAAWRSTPSTTTTWSGCCTTRASTSRRTPTMSDACCTPAEHAAPPRRPSRRSQLREPRRDPPVLRRAALALGLRWRCWPGSAGRAPRFAAYVVAIALCVPGPARRAWTSAARRRPRHQCPHGHRRRRRRRARRVVRSRDGRLAVRRRAGARVAQHGARAAGDQVADGRRPGRGHWSAATGARRQIPVGEVRVGDLLVVRAGRADAGRRRRARRRVGVRRVARHR